jgi:hypothetical protein
MYQVIIIVLIFLKYKGRNVKFYDYSQPIGGIISL